MDNSTSSSGSNASSTQHQALLSTVMELKADLERTMSKMQTMDEQNRQLTNNYTQVKDELIDTRRKYNECRENYLTTVADKLADEERREQFNEKLKLQLTEKTKEFETLRDKFAPKDIDYIRIKVQEELEIPHKQRLSAMEDEVKLHKENYYTMKRELESAKAEYEAYSQNQAREVTAIREENDSVVNILREQIARLQESDAVSEKDDIIRSKNNKIHELSISLEISSKDSRNLQDERDRSNLQLKEYKSKALETLENLKSRVLIAETEKNGAEKKLSHLIGELDKKESAIRIANQQFEDAIKSSEMSKRALSNMESQILSLRTDHSKEIEDMTISSAADRSQLLEIHDNILEKLRDREESLRKAMRDISEIQARSENNESNLRRNHFQTITLLKKSISKLEIDNADINSKYYSLQSECTRIYEENDADINTYKADITRLKREKETLHDKVRELEHQVDTERRKNAGLRKDLVSRKEGHEADIHEEKLRTTAAEEELMPLRTKLIEVTARCTQLEGNYREAIAANSSLQEDATSKLQFLQKSYKDKIDILKNKLKNNLINEKKRGDAYKEKALEAHARNKGGGKE
jgi:chromosome segregation ATPase